MASYNDKLDADDQITMEESIASLVFEVADDRLGEDGASELGRRILLMVLEKFRPDLVEA